MKSSFIIVFICVCVGISSSFADTFVDICKRGRIGLKIKQITGAASCKQVSSEKMAEINKLSLEYEDISSIGDYAFSGLISLKEINLSSNLLKSISKHTFAGLISLEKINLSYNDISNIELSAFQDLTSLKEINLSYNLIESISISELGLSENVLIRGVVTNP